MPLDQRQLVARDGADDRRQLTGLEAGGAGGGVGQDLERDGVQVGPAVGLVPVVVVARQGDLVAAGPRART